MTDIVTVTIDDTFPIKEPSVFNGVLFPAGDYVVQCDLDIEVTQASNRHEPWSDPDTFEIVNVEAWIPPVEETKSDPLVWFLPPNGDPEPWYDHATEVDPTTAETIGNTSVVRWLCKGLDLDTLTDGLF